MQFYFRKGWQGEGSHSRRYGAFYLITAATICLLIGPLKNLLVNIAMQSFKENGYDDSIGNILEATTNEYTSQVQVWRVTILGYIFLTMGAVQQISVSS